MITPYLVTKFEYANNVLAKCQGSTGDPEIASYLSSYLVVMLSGVYEDCAEYLLTLRAAMVSDAEVTSYVEKTLHETFRNPNFSKILEVLRKFSGQYAEQLRTAVVERDTQALDSIVNNKNLIAHGKLSQVTLREVSDFHGGVVRIFEAMENVLT